MTPEQQRLAFKLVTRAVPGGISAGEFLEQTGIAQPLEWALDQLHNAMLRHDGADAEAALMVSGTFGEDARWVEPYIQLLESDWHTLHEHAAEALGEDADERGVPALVHVAHWVPEYLDYDEGRALAVKAIDSLSKIPGREAESALRDLLKHEDHSLRASVQRALGRRVREPPPHQ